MKYRSRYDIIRFVLEHCKDVPISETRALTLAGTNPPRWKEIRKDAFDTGMFVKMPDGKVKASKKAIQWMDAWDKAKALMNIDTPELESEKTGERPKRKIATSKAAD